MSEDPILQDSSPNSCSPTQRRAWNERRTGCLLLILQGGAIPTEQWLCASVNSPPELTYCPSMLRIGKRDFLAQRISRPATATPVRSGREFPALSPGWH